MARCASIGDRAATNTERWAIGGPPAPGAPGIRDPGDPDGKAGAVANDRSPVNRVLGAIVGPAVGAVDPDALLERVDIETLIQRIDVDALISRVDLDALLLRIDVDALMARIDVDALVRRVDLDAGHPLPEAPWFPRDTVRSARRVFVHIIAETAQHAGHADILRESIDGARTMG